MSVSENDSRDFDMLYEQYRGMVYKLSLKYSDYDDSLAQDATQHTFICLYEEMKKNTVIANIQTYLHTIVKNYTLNAVKQYRYSYMQEELSPEEDCEAVLVRSAEDEYVETIEKQQTNLMVKAILSALREKNRIWYYVVMEVFYKGRSQSEVAKELEMNDTAMYATVRRIRKWLKKHKAHFEQISENATKEVSEGHLFSCDDEFAHISNKRSVKSDR